MVSPMDSVLAKIHQERAYVFPTLFWQVVKRSQRRRIKHFNRHQRKIRRLRIHRQSRFHVRTVAGGDQTARLVDSRRPRPGIRSGDVPLPHLLLRTRMTTCVSSKLRQFVTTQHASGQDTGCSFAHNQKRPGVATSGKPTIRTAITNGRQGDTPCSVTLTPNMGNLKIHNVLVARKSGDQSQIENGQSMFCNTPVGRVRVAQPHSVAPSQTPRISRTRH